MQINSFTSRMSGVTGEVMVSTAAVAMIALMLVPLTLFMTSVWIDQTFLATRRRGGEEDAPFDRHEAARRSPQPVAAAA